MEGRISMEDNLVKSKSRVKQFGEVYTPSEIVKNMLDLDGIRECSYGISKTFLEPSCGNGNFLIEILNRKLDSVGKIELDNYDVNLCKAISSVYGIEIQMDNVIECRNRLEKLVEDTYTEFNGKEMDAKLKNVVSLILSKNILCGDTLDGVEYKANKIKTDKPLIITEWIFDNDMVERKEIEFNNLIKENNILYNTYNKEYEKVHYMSVKKAKTKKEESDEFNLADIL